MIAFTIIGIGIIVVLAFAVIGFVWVLDKVTD